MQSTIKMRGKRIGIEKVTQSSKRGESLLSMPEDSNAIGFVRYAGDESIFKVGEKVVFGKNYHQIKLQAADILVMDDDNVYAYVLEGQGEDAQAAAQQ